MRCEHFYDIDTETRGYFVEYYTYRCLYCDHTKQVRENNFVTLVGFLPRLVLWIPKLIIKLLKN
jgi:hypothetical protein